MIQGNSQSNETRRKRNQRIMKILITINVVFCICWTPNYVIVLLFEFSKDFQVYKFEMLFVFCYYIFPILNTAFNPVILFTFSTNCRQALANCISVAFARCRGLCFKTEQKARPMKKILNFQKYIYSEYLEEDLAVGPKFRRSAGKKKRRQTKKKKLYE